MEQIAPVSTPSIPCASPLGVVDFATIAQMLRMSSPTLERLVRNDAAFPRLFKIGGKRFARLADLQAWVDQKAAAA